MTQVISQNNDGTRTYTFASQPRPVKQRKKYRDPEAYENEGPLPYGNIMYDRRIIRGNTYAQHTLPVSAQPDPIEIQRQQEARRRAIARKRAKKQLAPKSPEAVEGRRHVDVQTELYLEELTDRVEEADVETQTDAFLDRPPSPLYIPAKTGIDVSTQILQGELFDFDIEVKPILEVLVGKTMEQALIEVMEEEELANLRSQQRRFEELRNAELVETQRLEEQERRHHEEKERRIKQQIDVLKKEKETAEKIAARAFAQSYLADMIPSVFGSLNEHGYFYDPVERDVETYFMPWLEEQIQKNLDRYQVACLMLDSMIRKVVKGRLDSYSNLEQLIMKSIEESSSMFNAEGKQEEKNSTDVEVGQGDSEGVEDNKDKGLEEKTKGEVTEDDGMQQAKEETVNATEEQADNAQVNEQADNAQVNEQADNAQVNEQADNAQVNEQVDNAQVNEQADNAQVNEQADNAQVNEQADNAQVNEQADNAQVNEDVEEEQ
ncbi:radial spoke head protein 3 homolog B-like [Xenia sp. Carnegie-2017]|uniref:radial spoke head protein 3 homolog B-like n=1 Tax=Xenia sp. Carnegie-2017 TaxID=2897299 RepID=UPI001F04C857|nr:radial spoke head protein 3 homolog B-like [Xenia sp. Carnegie-2017]